MKKKILLALFMVAILACVLVISVGAVEIDYNEKAVLADGIELPIYDENQNPLIWYVKDANASGINKYASVPNNRTTENDSKDTYVTYTNANGNQLKDITFYIYDEAQAKYVSYTENSLQVVVLNLRGLKDFVYLNSGFKCSDIQCIYFHEELLDCCAYFNGSTALRLVDLSVCTKMTGGFGGERNFYNCTNLHTIRFAPSASYALTCSKNYNWRFRNTGLKQIVIPANVTSLGVDNFKDCKQLESVYILGNTTSLGQRNFPGCTNLTSIYILGDNPAIDINSFRDNFYECAEGNTTHDFKNTGKYFYFVTTNLNYLEQVKAAIGATSIVSYADFSANPSSYTEGRYIISGTNICDVLYNGVHDAPSSEQNPCAGICTICGELAPAKNPVHTFVNNCIYENGYLYEGKLEITCANEGCEYHEDGGVLDAIIEFVGYSTPEKNADRLTVSYTVNKKANDRYKELTGKTLQLGLVASFATDSENLEPVIVENGVAKENYEKTVCVSFTSEYVGFDFILSGFNSGEKNYCDTPLVMCAFVVDGESAYYICYDSEFNKVQSEYAYTITLNTIVE